MWVPNIVVALWGLVLIVEKAAGARGVVACSLRCRSCGGARAPRRRRTAHAGPARGTRVVVVIKIPHIAFPRPSILDWYVLKQGLRVSVLAAVGLLGLFYIASFIDLSDHLFKGRTTGLR